MGHQMSDPIISNTIFFLFLCLIMAFQWNFICFTWRKENWIKRKNKRQKSQMLMEREMIWHLQLQHSIVDQNQTLNNTTSNCFVPISLVFFFFLHWKVNCFVVYLFDPIWFHVLPIKYKRREWTKYQHNSSGSRSNRHMNEKCVRVCVCVYSEQSPSANESERDSIWNHAFLHSFIFSICFPLRLWRCWCVKFRRTTNCFCHMFAT